MTAAAAIADPDPARTQLRLAVLRSWAEAGMALVRRIVAEPASDLVARGVSLLRVSQAVRLVFVLLARLSDPLSLFHPAPNRPRAPRDPEPDAPREARAESGDRLRLPGEPVSDAAILRRPLVEIVKVICEALGVTPDWSLWSDATDAPAPPHAAPSSAPSEPTREIPRPPPRPRLVLDLAPARRAVGRTLARLRSSCAPQALLPLAAPASGRLRLPIALYQAPLQLTCTEVDC